MDKLWSYSVWWVVIRCNLNQILIRVSLCHQSIVTLNWECQAFASDNKNVYWNHILVTRLTNSPFCSFWVRNWWQAYSFWRVVKLPTKWEMISNRDVLIQLFWTTTQFKFRQSVWIQFKFNSSRCSLHQNLIHDSIHPSISHLNSVNNSIQLSKFHFNSIHNSIPLKGGQGVFPANLPFLVGYAVYLYSWRWNHNQNSVRFGWFLTPYR